MSDIRSGLANNDDQRTSSPTTLAAFLQGLYSITCTFKTGAFDQAFGSNPQDEIKEPLIKPCSLVKQGAGSCGGAIIAKRLGCSSVQ